MAVGRLVTLSKMHFLFVMLCLLVLAVVCAVVVFFPYGVYNLKCHFELPEYEKSFGFRLGEIEVPSSAGGSTTVSAITAVEPNGVFARSGVRVGDIPRIHHGSADFCGVLSAARDGRPVELRVYNLNDAKDGTDPWREVTLRR